MINKNKVAFKIRPHGRPIKDICFLTSNKILTASDDGLIKMIDLEKQCEESYFFGHKYGVNSLDMHPYDEKVHPTVIT